MSETSSGIVQLAFNHRYSEVTIAKNSLQFTATNTHRNHRIVNTPCWEGFAIWQLEGWIYSWQSTSFSNCYYALLRSHPKLLFGRYRRGKWARRKVRPEARSKRRHRPCHFMRSCRSTRLAAHKCIGMTQMQRISLEHRMQLGSWLSGGPSVCHHEPGVGWTKCWNHWKSVFLLRKSSTIHPVPSKDVSSGTYNRRTFILHSSSIWWLLNKNSEIHRSPT